MPQNVLLSSCEQNANEISDPDYEPRAFVHHTMLPFGLIGHYIKAHDSCPNAIGNACLARCRHPGYKNRA